ncbi:GEVED domain-containing protein [Nocardiopsis sp. RSe5-2]|uniref:GEVED domain-containing protein n=1 Tax=Nocardiopsis endophytica TaxID=3018445 RepID=A0ABT4TXQ3_9ACTN|nr:GEVED domain-containing protein [Nocardiopsis endophytica]MDA2809476.1 GEVED domain-containing protein [Nocardiopsis endophytica]
MTLPGDRPERSPRRDRTRRWTAAIAATAVGAVAAVPLHPQAAAAEPGHPGVPSDPPVLFQEDFEQAGDGSNTSLQDYVGATGQTYTADPYWVNRPDCNGFIVDATSQRQDDDCTSAGQEEGAFTILEKLTRALGTLRGSDDPGTNAGVASFTEGDGPDGAVQFRTATPIALPVESRFVTFSVDAAAMNCQYADMWTPPKLRFSLIDSQGTERPMSDSAIDVCSDPRGIDIPGETGFRAGTFPADGSYLLRGGAFDIVLRNDQGQRFGNDGAYDNIAVLDVTPQLDKEFDPQVRIVGETSRLTLAVTNTSELAAKNGWAFTDTLPDGLRIADDPNLDTTCTADVEAEGGGSTVTVTDGALAAQEVSCTIALDVTSDQTGTFTNGPGEISDAVGINPPEDTDVSFADADFGDAPDSYKTTLADDGPVHLLTDEEPDAHTAALMLGDTVDAEPDGVPGPGADGDDDAGPADDDEDAVGPITGLVGHDLTVPVKAANDTAEPATLAGWVDLDRDGSFGEDERRTATVPADAGTTTVELDFPAPADEGGTYARFRIAPEGAAPAGADRAEGDDAPAPIGRVVGGEVEDHPVTIGDRALEIAKSVDPAGPVQPGDTVTYTVTATNTGSAAYTGNDPAVVTDDLSGVLDDAAYGEDAAASADGAPVGEIAYSAPELTWSGPLEPGQTVTITYTAVVGAPDGGDGKLANAATTDDPNGRCEGDDPDNCSTKVDVLPPAPAPTPTPTPTPTPDPTPEPTPEPEPEPSPSHDGPVPPVPPDEAGPPEGDDDGYLPLTGGAVAGLLAAGAVLVAIGAVALRASYLRRSELRRSA